MGSAVHADVYAVQKRKEGFCILIVPLFTRQVYVKSQLVGM